MHRIARFLLPSLAALSLSSFPAVLPAKSLFSGVKVQYAEMDVKNSLFQFHVKGQNSLHIFSADLAVFTPANTRGARLYLKDNIIGGSGFVKEVQGAEDSGNYKVVADEFVYTADSLKLLKAVSQQLALALRKNQ